MSYLFPKFLLVSILLFGLGPYLSAEPADSVRTPSQEVDESMAGETSTAVPDVAREGAEATGDPSDQDHWLDRYRDIFKSTVDDGANWVDGALATEGMEDEPENAYGRVSGNVYWQNRAGFTFRGRFRVKVNLDATNRRFNAIIGRGDPADFIDDRYNSSPRFASFYRGDASDEFLAGVSYRPDWTRSGSFSLGGGLSFSDGVNPYVNINYRYRHVSDDDRWMLGAYQTFYYQTGDDGFGSRTTIEPEYLISDNWLIRNYTSLELNQSLLGLEWQTTFSLYQDLGRNRAIAYEAGVYGETGRQVSYVNYGVTVTYRQRMFRDWFYGEVTVGVAYPREYPGWERRGDPLIGFGVEFFFGAD